MENPSLRVCTILLWAGGCSVGWRTCCGIGDMPWEGTCCGVMLREGVWGQDHPWVPKSSTTSGHTGSALGGQGAPWDRDTLLWGLFPLPTPWGPISPSLSHSTVHPLPHQGSQALLFTFQMGNKLQPSLCTQNKKPTKPQKTERREINKQLPSLSWFGICSQPLHY